MSLKETLGKQSETLKNKKLSDLFDDERIGVGRRNFYHISRDFSSLTFIYAAAL